MIQLADWGLRSELAEIWQTCFDEPARPARYFLNNDFRPENCLVYRVGNKTASVVYLLPVKVASKDGPLQAHYIYAAATLPQYRGRGFMAALLAGAALVGAKRGDQYSVVLPATKELYPLYQKSDYLPFFQVRNVSLSIEELCSVAESGRIARTAIDCHVLNTLRNTQLSGKAGSVLWSDEGFAFAAGMGGVYGDRLVASLTDGRPAYALCRRLDKDTCAVQEIMADLKSLPDLAANMMEAVPAETYRFRLQSDSGLFTAEGETVPFGMIKPIGGASMQPIQPPDGSAYLGLSLD